METPLDHDTHPVRQRPIFSYSAIIFGFITMTLIVIGFLTIPARIRVGDMFAIPSWIPKGIQVSFFLSLLFTILSFTSKEKTKVKWVAIGLNLFAIVIIMGLVLFYRAMSSK